MCFPRCYQPSEIQTDEFGEVIDLEDPLSLHNILLFNNQNNIPWPDPNLLAIVVYDESTDSDLYIFQSEYAMYFSHLFFNTPVYSVRFLQNIWVIVLKHISSDYHFIFSVTATWKLLVRLRLEWPTTTGFTMKTKSFSIGWRIKKNTYLSTDL